LKVKITLIGVTGIYWLTYVFCVMAMLWYCINMHMHSN